MNLRLVEKENGRPTVRATYNEVVGPGYSIFGGGLGNQAGHNIGADFSQSALMPMMLEGFLDNASEEVFQEIYRDMYLHDHICGSTIDLRANLPWSDFTLSGTDNEETLNTYMDTIESLNLKTAHAPISVEQMVTGTFIGSLIYNKELKEKSFVDIVPYHRVDCMVEDVPIYSRRPILKLKVPARLKRFAQSKDKYIMQHRHVLPDRVVKQYANNRVVKLHPKTTIYLPRTTMMTSKVGISYLHRILPLYILERVLYRGTLVESTKRQRGITHVVAGDEDWIPTKKDLDTLTRMINVTERDPLSNVLATRSGINISDVRPAGDFYKWTDVASELASMKMRALGISDAFLSADANWSTMETSLSVFIEEMKAFRNDITRRLYYNQLFPLIAMMNEFYKDGATNIDETKSENDLDFTLNETQNLLIPEIKYQKSLQPEGDREYVELLDMAEEKGIPITLRMRAAALGINMDQLEADLPDDKALRERLKPFKPKEEEMGFSLKSGLENPGLSRFWNIASLVPNIEDYYDIKKLSKSGKKLKRITNQKKAQREANRSIAKALKNLSDANHYHQVVKGWSEKAA